MTAERLAHGGSTLRDGAVPRRAPLCCCASATAASRSCKSNAGASLVDLGDGVLAVEFHSKMNTIGGDALAMLEAGVARSRGNFAALIVGIEARHFSAGANLMLLLLEAQEGNWDEIDPMVRAFQQATMALQYAAVPVVAAPAGLALGGGCEIGLHADRVQAAAETYIGLVEVGVGLIPAGGGSKEMRCARADDRRGGARRRLLPRCKWRSRRWPSARCRPARPTRAGSGYLRDADASSMNRERVIADAKALALARADGYQPPRRVRRFASGRDRLRAARARRPPGAPCRPHQRSRRAVGRSLARVMSGGDARARRHGHRAVPARSRARGVPESVRRAQRRSSASQHMLKTGKTLRN